jgi:superfamily II DNA helicase RecQ
VQISEAVLKNHIKVLYVAPERLCTPAFRRLITLLNQQQRYQHGYHPDSAPVKPVVSLLCVDEAHCLSQWSYNFRPAFLRIRREIQFIQPAAVLALTATATPRIQVRHFFSVWASVLVLSRRQMLPRMDQSVHASINF